MSLAAAVIPTAVCLMQICDTELLHATVKDRYFYAVGHPIFFPSPPLLTETS